MEGFIIVIISGMIIGELWKPFSRLWKFISRAWKAIKDRLPW